jgi:HEAT repeat protein
LKKMAANKPRTRMKNGEIMVDLSSIISSNWRERKQAIDALAGAPAHVLAQGLLEIMRKEHQNLGALNAALQLLQLLDAPVTDGLVALLEDPDPEIRIYAAQAFSTLKVHSLQNHAVDALLNVLNTPHEGNGQINVCFNVIEALGVLRVSRAVEPLQDILKEGNYFLSFAALRALGQIGDRRVLPDLLLLLQDPMLASPSAEALGDLGDPAAIEPLANWLEDESGEVAAAVPALVKLAFQGNQEGGEPEAALVQRVVTAVGPKGLGRVLDAVPAEPGQDLSDEQAAALPYIACLFEWLLESPPAENIGRLSRALVTLLHYATAQQAAAKALSRRGQAALPELVALLLPDAADEGLQSFELRLRAARVLGAIGGAEAVRALITALDAGEVEVVIAAAHSLGSSGDAAAFEPLLEKLRHHSPGVRKAVLQGLIALQHPDLWKRLVQLLQSPEPELREAALRAFALSSPTGAGDGKNEGIVPLILAALADPEIIVRRVAVEALAHFDDPQIPDALAETIQNNDPTLRAAAARALAFLHPETALPLLHNTIRDPDPWVRMYACRSLAQLGSAQSLEHIAVLLNDPLPPVRVALTEALVRIGGPQAVSELRTLLTDPNSDVQQAAEKALAMLAGHHRWDQGRKGNG